MFKTKLKCLLEKSFHKTIFETIKVFQSQVQCVTGQCGGIWLQDVVHQSSIPGLNLQTPTAWQDLELLSVVSIVVVGASIVVVSR